MRLLATLTLSYAALLGLTPGRVMSQQTRATIQEWSPAEHAVWAVIEQGWQALGARDVDRFMASFHPHFLGWNMSRPAPLDLAAERRGTEEFLAQYEWESYTIEPVAIRIVGDDAVVHYRYREVVRPAAGGASQQEDGRATQVLRRVDGRWKTLTIMSGPVSGPPPSPSDARFQ